MLPENGGHGGVERWYSYDWGDVHLVALDTDAAAATQAAWLEADLAANQLPWTIVYGTSRESAAIRRVFFFSCRCR